VATRVYVWSEIDVGMCGIVNPNLYRVWEESGRIKIRLEVKFEVLLKMKPHKIQRLEFVSDKTEAGIATGRSCASVLIVP
jgi:hypothetical protein